MLQNLEELLETKQYIKLREELLEMNAADIASLLEELPTEELTKIFRILPKSIAADTFSYLPIEVEQALITSLSDREAAGIIDNLQADDAADLVEEMPAGIVKRLLANADPETRRDINHLLKYPEDSAGSIMTVEFVDLKESLTVAQAIQRIRRTGIDKETIDTCYVLDVERKLIGTVSLRRLLLCRDEETIGSIMNDYIITVTTLTDQEEVARIFQKYDFTTMPVVDSENRLVGIITVDDVMDIIEQETTEDIEMMAAITPTDKSYMKTGVMETWKKRIPWLLFLMISATFTGKIIAAAEDALAASVALTMYIPMLMDTGGNAGGQASVTIIRGLSLDEIEYADVPKIVWKEFRVAALAGVTLALANMAKMMLFDRVSFTIALIVCITIIAAVCVAKLVGCTLPILAKKIGFDPAVMASPFITTIVDAVSLLIYFQIAKMFLGI